MSDEGGTVLSIPRCGECAHGKHVKCEHPQFKEQEGIEWQKCCCVVRSQTSRIEP